MHKTQLDALTDDGQDYIYRGGLWTTKAGYSVSTTYGHTLTMKFYERHGRTPVSDPLPTPAVNAKAARAVRTKTARVRAAVAKFKRAKTTSARAKATA